MDDSQWEGGAVPPPPRFFCYTQEKGNPYLNILDFSQLFVEYVQMKNI